MVKFNAVRGDNMIKRIIYTLLLIIWMVVIFMFSNANNVKSQNTSDTVTKKVIETTSKITNTKIDKKKEEKMVKDYRVLIRKTAHFSLYLVLGILIYLTLSSYGISKRVVIYSVIFCFIYAISDEIHQLFSDGRSFEVRDILIDTLGSCTGIFIIYLVNSILLRNKNMIK